MNSQVFFDKSFLLQNQMELNSVNILVKKRILCDQFIYIWEEVKIHESTL